MTSVEKLDFQQWQMRLQAFKAECRLRGEQSAILNQPSQQPFIESVDGYFDAREKELLDHAQHGRHDEAHAVFAALQAFVEELLAGGVTPQIQTRLASWEAAAEQQRQADLLHYRPLWDEVDADLNRRLQSTAPVDREVARGAVADLYRAIGRPVPASIRFLEPGFVPPAAAENTFEARALPGIAFVRSFEADEPDQGDIELPEPLQSIGIPGERAWRRWETIDRFFGDPFSNQHLRQQLGLHQQGLSSNYFAILDVGSLQLAVYRPLAMRSRESLGIAFTTPAEKLHSFLPKLAALERCFDVCGICYLFSDWVLVVGRPQAAHFDDDDRLHNADGPALIFADGVPHYFWHGVEVPEAAILTPALITAAMIRSEQNQEVRRVLIERMGAEGFIRQSGALAMHKDETGVLWRADFRPPAEQRLAGRLGDLQQ